MVQRLYKIIEIVGIIKIIKNILFKIRNSSVFIPLLIFFIIVFLYILTSFLTQFKPVIESIEPEIGQPGDVLVIKGKYFGNPAENKNENRVTIKPVDSSVYISHDRLVLSDYIKWENDRISVRIPSNTASGPVFIESKRGKSNEVVFINKKEIPTILSGPVDPGQPYISSFEPKEASVSDVITITGINFGMEKGNNQVYFTLGAATSARTESNEAPYIAAASSDYAYISWTDNEIKVRLPDGASSGKVWVNINGKNSNSFYLEKIENIGTRTFGERRGYKVGYDVVLNVNNASGENSIYFWIPNLSSSAEQRNIKYERNLAPELDNYSNMMLYKFANLKDKDAKTVAITAWLERYEMFTKINREKVSWDYEKDTQFFREYTSDLYDLKLNDPRLNDIFKGIGRGRDPYTTAESIYNVIRNINYSENPYGDDVIDNYLKKSGDSYTYAMMFTALARKAGIPARPVAGFFVYDNTKVVKHFWAEFYIKKFGWVAVDAALGTGITFGNMPQVENPKTYYFGNLDSRHITFSRGIISVPIISPAGKNVVKNKMYSLQTSYEELSGDIKAYKSSWNELKILEWW